MKTNLPYIHVPHHTIYTYQAIKILATVCTMETEKISLEKLWRQQWGDEAGRAEGVYGGESKKDQSSSGEE